MRKEQRGDENREKNIEEKEAVFIDPKTNNDSSYNRNKPSQLCQTLAFHLKGITEGERKESNQLSPSLGTFSPPLD